MKYALIFALAGIVFWFWRSQRLQHKNELHGDERGTPQSKSSGANLAVEIVACSVCHVHLPRQEALTGPSGPYCSEAHKHMAGD